MLHGLMKLLGLRQRAPKSKKMALPAWASRR